MARGDIALLKSMLGFSGISPLVMAAGDLGTSASRLSHAYALSGRAKGGTAANPPDVRIPPL